MNPTVKFGCFSETSVNKPLEKRLTYYVQQPKQYEIAPCSCGNEDTQWSEWKHHLWCDKCQKDFVPEHNGIFDGPIPIGAAMLMGISFDQIDIATGNIIKFEMGVLQKSTTPP